MVELVVAILVLGGFFVLRGIAATWAFFYIMPVADNCPNCDSVTVRVESRVWRALAPRLRNSWCLHCGWHGLLRDVPARAPVPRRQSAVSQHPA